MIVKNIFSKFFNTAFVYALVYFFGPKVNFLNTNGLVYVIFSLIAVNAGLTLATEIIQPSLLIARYMNRDTL